MIGTMKWIEAGMALLVLAAAQPAAPEGAAEQAQKDQRALGRRRRARTCSGGCGPTSIPTTWRRRGRTRTRRTYGSTLRRSQLRCRPRSPRRLPRVSTDWGLLESPPAPPDALWQLLTSRRRHPRLVQLGRLTFYDRRTPLTGPADPLNWPGGRADCLSVSLLPPSRNPGSVTARSMSPLIT